MLSFAGSLKVFVAVEAQFRIGPDVLVYLVPMSASVAFAHFRLARSVSVARSNWKRISRWRSFRR